MFENIGIMEKQVGYNPLDKDIYVINEWIEESKFISLEELRKKNGGLLRIGVVNYSGTVVNIVKEVGEQLLRIME